MMSIRKKIQDGIFALFSVVLFLSVWSLIFVFFPQQGDFLPSPISVLVAFSQLFQQGDIWMHIFASVRRVLIGFISVAFLAVGLALLAGYFKNIGRVLKPIVEILRPIPPIAWIPLAILLFGLGDASAYFIVMMGAFFPIFSNTYFGVISLPVVYENVARSFEIKKHVFIKDILFKFSLPYIFTGLKIGMGMAWMSVIAAELIGAQSGLGYFIQLNRLVLRTEYVVAGMILIGFIGFFLNWILSVLEKKIIPWNNVR